MSGAERMRRHRARQVVTKPITKSTAAVAKLEARVVELEEELARERARRGETKTGIARTAGRRQEFGTEIGRLRAEIGKLKSDITKLKAMLAEEPDAARLRKKVVDQQVEVTSMRRVMKKIAKERDEYRARVEPKYREATGLATRATFNAIIKALHFDRRQQIKPNELAEAERLFITLKPLFVEAAS